MKALVKLGLSGASVAVAMALLAGVQMAYAQGLPNLNTLIFAVPPQGPAENLFKTVLDALGEAHYVEPAARAPRRDNVFNPPGRTDIATLRNAAGYTPSSAKALTETSVDKDKLSDVVTRSITLEGQDVRTQERADEFAREVVRQRQLADVIEKLCREAFGSENCQLGQQPLDPARAAAASKQRERAYVTDPLALARLPLENGALAVLDSGDPAYQKKAEQVLQQAKQGGQVLPLAYSSDIAEIRLTLNQYGPQAAIDKFEELVNRVKADYQPRPFDVEVWRQNIQAAAGLNKKGEVEFVPSSGFSQEANIDRSRRATSAALNVIAGLRSISEAASNRVAGQLFTTMVDNAIPDRAQLARPGYNRDKYGEIRIIDTAPANVKVGLQRELLPLLAQAIANPDFIDPGQLTNPAGKSAVDQQGQAGLNIGDPLESFEKANVVDEGLYYHSGVTLAPGLPGLNAFQDIIPAILRKIGK